MLAKVFSATTFGFEAIKIVVEVDISSRGLPSFQIVGLPSKAIDEARVRVTAAIKNSGFPTPQTHVVVNLAPAHLKKDGSLFDLPIALCILTALGVVHSASLGDSLFIGELSLNGSVTEITGIVPIALLARKSGMRSMFVPEVNAAQASLVDGVAIFQVGSLKKLVDHLNGKEKLQVLKSGSCVATEEKSNYPVDFS